MAMELPQKSLKNKRSALIFGNAIISRMIAQDLQAEGFVPHFAPSSLNSSVQSCNFHDRLAELKQVVLRFAEESQGQGIIHPGTSLWSERPELVSLGEQAGLQVISPSARVLSLLRNKLNFLLEAEELGIPNLVQSFDPIHTVREIEEFIDRTGQTYPFVLKSIRGGGSSGVFVVQSSQGLVSQLSLWFDQLRRNLGEIILFAEKYVEGARQIGIPFVRFADGQILTFPEMDVSLQCRYRKVVEFCPAPCLDEQTRNQVERWVSQIAEKLGFVGLGFVEFLLDGTRAFLIDISPRLNQGFHLWEKVGETKAVLWQLEALEKRKQDRNVLDSKKKWKTGMSFRIHAEDSIFHLPQPGHIAEISKANSWIQETDLAEIFVNHQPQDRVSVFDQGLLAQGFVFADSYAEALQRGRETVSKVWISGSLQTDERFLLELMDHPWVKEAIFHSAFVDEEFVPQVRPPVEILKGFIFACQKETTELGKLGYWMVGDQTFFIQNQSLGQLQWLGEPLLTQSFPYEVKVGRIQLSTGVEFPVSISSLEGRWLVRMGAWFMSVRYLGLENQDKKPRFASVISGRVHALFFRAGSTVPAHEPLVMVESLGIFVPHALPVDGKILNWKVKPDEIIDAGRELADIEVVGKGD